MIVGSSGNPHDFLGSFSYNTEKVSDLIYSQDHCVQVSMFRSDMLVLDVSHKSYKL